MMWESESERVGELVEYGRDTPIERVDELFAERHAVEVDEQRRIDQMLFSVAISSDYLRPAILEGFRWIATDPNRSQAERTEVALMCECLDVDAELEFALRQDLYTLPYKCQIRSGPWSITKRDRYIAIEREGVGRMHVWGSSPTRVLAESEPELTARLFSGGVVKNPRPGNRVYILNDRGRRQLLSIVASGTIEVQKAETEIGHSSSWLEEGWLKQWMGYDC